MAEIVVPSAPCAEPRSSYGLYSHALFSHGLYGYGPCIYGLYGHGLHSYGYCLHGYDLYSYGQGFTLGMRRSSNVMQRYS